MLDPGVANILAKTIGIDTHNHIDTPLTDAEMPGPNLDLKGEMKQSGLSAICMTFATEYQPGDAYQRFLKGLASMDRQLERNGLKRSLTPEDIRTAHKDGQPTVVQAIEGAHFLQGRYGGLTTLGAAVIKECNRLGILVDLAHADLQTTEGALKVTTRPVIISHTGLDRQLGSNPRMAQMMRPRLISKEQARIVADAAGLIGVWTHLSDTPVEYARSVRALVDVIGVDHVCIGTDTKLTPPSPRPNGPRPGPPPDRPHPDGPPRDGFRPGQQQPRIGERTNKAWADEKVGFYYAVVDPILQTGFTPDDIGKIGGSNFLRVFGTAISR